MSENFNLPYAVMAAPPSANLPRQRLDVGIITCVRDIGTTRVQDDTKFSKVGQAVDPEFRREIRSQIIALQKLREGEVVETEDGTEFIQGHTPYDTSKKAVERARQLMLGEDPTEPERSTTEEAINRAIERYDLTGRRMLIANLAHSPRPLTDIEVHAILKFAEDTLKLFANGEITQDEARQRIIRKIGNFTRPESIRSVSGVDAGTGYRTYDGKLFGAKLPEQKLDVGTITFGRDTGTARVQDDTKFSKGEIITPELAVCHA